MAAETTPRPSPRFLVRDTRLLDDTVSVRVEIPLDPPGPKPAILVLIGDMRHFTEAGYVTVTYRVNADRRRGAKPTVPPSEHAVGMWVLASPSAGVLGQTYLRKIASTAGEIVPAVLDWLQTFPEVDGSRIGMAGGSTNGFITLQALAADPRLRVAVVIAACGDYHRFLQDSSMGMKGQPLALDPAYEAWLREQEIVARPDRLLGKALLMVNRTQDEMIPISCADETARLLGPAYREAGMAERFRYVRLEASGHGIATAERREAAAWFEKWMSPSTPRTARPTN